MSFVSMMPQHVMGSDHLGRCDSFLSRVPSFMGPLPAPVLKLHLGVLLFLQSWLAWWWRCSAAQREEPRGRFPWPSVSPLSGRGLHSPLGWAVEWERMGPWENNTSAHGKHHKD